VTSENLPDLDLTGAVGDPTCEGLVEDNGLAKSEADIALNNQESEAENNNGKVVETEEPLPAMSEAGMASNHPSGEIDVSNYPALTR
jgi:hypothetical protein